MHKLSIGRDSHTHNGIANYAIMSEFTRHPPLPTRKVLEKGTKKAGREISIITSNNTNEKLNNNNDEKTLLYTNARGLAIEVRVNH